MPYLSKEKRDRLRPLVRKLLKTGAMIPSEVALAAGVSRQVVSLWTKDINWPAARIRHVRRVWREAARR